MGEPLVIVADPPWKFGDSLPGKGRGAAKHYDCLGVPAIALQMAAVSLAADNAVLFLWRVAAMQREALDLVESLSFTVKTELVWEKLTSGGKAHFGMGHYLRASHETCLIATRGKAMPAVRNVRSRFAAPVREHSRKPEEFYRIVETLYPGSRKVEMFARTVRPGWEQEGLELGKFEAAQ